MCCAITVLEASSVQNEPPGGEDTHFLLVARVWVRLVLLFVIFMVACFRSKTKCGCGTLPILLGRVSVADNWGGRLVVELVRIL